MTTIHNVFSLTSDPDSAIEHKRAVLARLFPHLVNHMSMFVGKPVRLIWNPNTATASTDCKAEVRMAPWFFLSGQDDVGFGTSIHEAGHIRWSPRGTELLARAYRAGGKTRQNIMNIILDRKDDILTADEAPGYAPMLRARLAYICTMSLRPIISELRPEFSEEEVTSALRNWKPRDVWRDFFFAAKWHKRPRIRRTHKAMKYLKRQRLLNASDAELLWIAERIHEILGEPEMSASTLQQRKAESAFNQLVLAATKAEQGERGEHGSNVYQILRGIAKNHVASSRATGLDQLIRTMQSNVVYSGPISVGRVDHITQHKIRPDLKFAGANQLLRQEIDGYVAALVQSLRRVDSPSSFMLYGQDEGDLDFDEIASIACGLPGVYEEEVIEREVDVEIHLAIDTSGSMYGEKLQNAKRIAKLFCEAIDALGESATGRVWCFDDSGVYDYGPPDPNNGFVAHEAGKCNSDTHMLQIVGSKLGQSQRKRKVLLTLCDDGPDSVTEVKRLSDMLLARGIVPVHMLVGVHGTPNIYPIELIYTSMEECLDQFGDLMTSIISNVK